MVRCAIGSTSSIATVPSGTPKKRRSWRGTIADHWPALTCETRLKIELVSTAGTGFAPTERKTPSMIRRFCMSGVNRHKGVFAASRQVTCVRPASGPRCGREKEIFLDADRFGLHVRHRFGVEVGEADVEFEVFDPAIDLLAVHGNHGDRHARKSGVKGAGQLGNERQRGRDDADPKPSGQALVDLLKPAAEILDLGENPVGVLEGDLPLRRQAHISVAALDDRRPEIVLEQPNRGRKGRLRHVAGVCGAAKMLFARERHEIFELTEDHDALSRRSSWRPASQGQ